MTIASNLYAEKVFAEHPLALWALDDPADFISVIPANSNQASSWTRTGTSSFSISTVANLENPIPDAYTMSFTGNTPTGPTETLTLKYSSAANFNQLNQSFGQLSIGFYLKAEGIAIEELQVGISYIDPATSTTETIYNSYNFVDNGWGFVGSTIDIPDINANFDIVISITYGGGASAYDFVINGLSVGQWSESFQASSTGVYPSTIPSDIATEETLGVIAYPYGLSDNLGYYISSSKQLFARNSGSPLVYGASSSTRLYPHTGPSLIFPGFGLMNQSGKYRDTTIEFWLRADTYSNTPRRVMGPIGKIYDGTEYVDSIDGLYINGSFLVLKLGKYYGSYFVSEWGRPMLVAIRIGEKSASLVINGEDVLSISIDASQIQFPEKFIYDEIAEEDKDQDWLGFYSYSDIGVMEIDAIGIYPYRVPTIVEKRRFVYGQGVDFPENLNTAFNGSSIFIDYSFSDYSNNYNYPDMGKWGQAATDNVSISGNILQAPLHQLPSVIFQNTSRTQDAWLEQNRIANEDNPETRPYVTLRPGSWTSDNGYILFNRLNNLSQNVAAIYGVFQPTELSESEQTLIYIENEINENYFTVTLTENVIAYKFKYGSSAVQTLFSVETVVPDLAFSAGFNINNLVNTYGGRLKTFFGSRDQLRVYVGGNKNFNSTFSGYIYNVGFATPRNAKKIESFFNESGIASIPTDVTDVFYLYFDNSPDGQIDFTIIGGYIDPFTNDWILFEGTVDGGFPDSFVFGRFQDHIASYTFIPKLFLGNLLIDIAADSYWEDYVPLSYFASFVSDAAGNRIQALDFIQFNISNPAPLTTGNGVVDTENSIVKTYITFQELATGSNALSESFIFTVPVSSSHVVKPGVDWRRTKYEVVSGDIIRLPNGVNLNNLSIGVHVEMQNPGIILNPVKINSLQLASQSLNFVNPNPVGTRFGYDIYPYLRSGIYFDYKNAAPYSIYKSSTPYLYMSKYSGIKLCDSTGSAGISIPINRSLSQNYGLGAIQFAAQYQEGLFPENPVEIFEIQSSNLYVKFYLVAANESRTRGKIYGINQATKTSINGLAYYLNGNLTKDLYLEADAWSIIGIQFSNALIFDSEAGALRLTGPMMFNNISYYQLPSTQTLLSIIFRRWNQLSDLADYWEDLTTPTQLLWQDILYISVETSFILNPATIFKEYVGTNRILVTSDKTLSFNNYQYSVFKDLRWQSNIVTPV